MSNYYLHDAPLEPKEPELRIAFICELCEEPIYEGDEYYDIPGLGKCCAECISDAHHYDAEASDNSDDLYDSMRGEELLDV